MGMCSSSHEKPMWSKKPSFSLSLWQVILTWHFVLEVVFLGIYQLLPGEQNFSDEQLNIITSFQPLEILDLKVF